MDDKLDPFDKRLGAELKKLRQKRGLSLPDVAAEIGVSYQQLQKYEAGRNSLSASRMVKLSGLLEVAPQEILDWLDSGNCPECLYGLEPLQRVGERHRLLRAYFALPENIRSAFLNLIEGTDTQQNR